MFNIGWSELLIIGIVALVVIGPKELPGALRTLGQWMTKVRRMASEFQNQFHEAMREAELADLKKEVDEMTAKAQSYAHFDPVEDIRKDIESAVTPPPEFNAPVTEASSAPTSSPAPGTEAAAAPAPAAPAQASPPDASPAPAATETAEPATTPSPKDGAVAGTPDTGRAA